MLATIAAFLEVTTACPGLSSSDEALNATLLLSNAALASVPRQRRLAASVASAFSEGWLRCRCHRRGRARTRHGILPRKETRRAPGGSARTRPHRTGQLRPQYPGHSLQLLL